MLIYILSILKYKICAYMLSSADLAESLHGMISISIKQGCLNVPCVLEQQESCGQVAIFIEPTTNKPGAPKT